MPKCTIDGKEIEVAAGTTVIQAALAAGDRDPPLLLAPRPARRRQLPHVPGRDREDAEAADRLQHRGHGRHGGAHAEREGGAGPPHHPRVPARQPPHRLPGLRPGRRVLPAGPVHGARPPRLARSSPRRRSRSARWWTSGPIMLDAERCVLCSRCLRFEAHVTGTNSFEFVNRGDHTQIATFEDRPITHNYAGNLADVCPVGALLSHDFRFKMRVWFLEAHGVGLPRLLHRLQHLRRPPRRRGAAPAPAPQRRGEQVLDVRHRPHGVQGDRARRRASPARACAAPRGWAGRDARPPRSTRVAARLKEAGAAARLRGHAAGHQRGPVRVPHAGRARRAACSTSASATRRTSVQVREDNVLLRADRNPNTQGCLDLGLGRDGRRRDPGGLPRRAR